MSENKAAEVARKWLTQRIQCAMELFRREAGKPLLRIIDRTRAERDRARADTKRLLGMLRDARAMLCQEDAEQDGLMMERIDAELGAAMKERERDRARAESLSAYVARQVAWSSRTFGHSARTLGVTKHIEKEIAEIRTRPHDLSEWIDVIILALDGYWRHGGDPREIMTHLQEKQDENFARRWPGPISEDEAIEHVRADDAAMKEESQ